MQHVYVPFAEVGKREVIHVDSFAGPGLSLSHWKGAATPDAVRGDSSVDSVLNALKADIPGLELTDVTASHWDIDGFLGVWCLLHEELALRHDVVLREAATIGDFGEYDPEREGADEALKLVCWMNAKEEDLFYPPFGSERERADSVDKFRYFMDSFAEVLEEPERFRDVWEPEYREVRRGYELMRSPATRLTREPAIGLIVIETPEPLPYESMFGFTVGYDTVLMMYGGNRYELEYKYTTWVDLASRPTLPRVSLDPLAARLNALETSGHTWGNDPMTDTGPILRLEGGMLTRQERFTNPTERTIFSSSIDPETLKAEVIGYYRRAYAGVTPRRGWTWADARELSQAIAGRATA